MFFPLEENAFLYIDDIIIFVRSPQHHNDNLRNVFTKLKLYNPKLNSEICSFPKPEVMYLGHLFAENSNIKDPSQTKSIKNVCKNVDYQRRFINNFAEKSKF